MFDMDETEALAKLDKALSLGGKLVFNGLDDPHLKCIVCRDPCGNEFEFNALSSPV
jgi:hypothetical protein